MELAFLSLEEILEKIKNGETSYKEVNKYFLNRINTLNPELNAFLRIFDDSEYFPIGVKDIFCVKGKVTSGASKMLENFKPPYSATTIEKLIQNNFSPIGMTNMDEFAMGSSGENSAFSVAKNPHGTNRIPGGSSSGSAVSVASGMIPASLGTDTGGSIRQPASMCGIVGFKPTYGRSSRFGIMPMSSSLDCPGTFTRTVKDAGILYEIMNGQDEKEDTSIKGNHKLNSEIWNAENLNGLKIGIPKEYFEEGLEENVRKTIEKAIEDLKSYGAEIVEISLPMTKYAVAAYYIICPAEVSTNLARLDGIRYGYNNENSKNLEETYLNNRSFALGKEPKRRSIIGAYVLSAGFYDAYFKKAAQIRTLIIKDFQKAFSEVDAIVCPVSPTVAWKIGEKIDDPLKMYLSDAYTIPASLAGLPGISVPCGFAESSDEEKENLPVGLQILTKNFDEETLFKVANVYEKKSGWTEKMIPEKYKV